MIGIRTAGFLDNFGVGGQDQLDVARRRHVSCRRTAEKEAPCEREDDRDERPSEQAKDEAVV
jgi:hypothetical protein